jgi:hypothetical protein
MAKFGAFGKDNVNRMGGAEGYIEDALRGGGQAPSEGIHDFPIDRPDQVIKRANALDNVRMAGFKPSSLVDVDTGMGGGVKNLKHTLEPNGPDFGISSPVKHTIIPNH